MQAVVKSLTLRSVLLPEALHRLEADTGVPLRVGTDVPEDRLIAFGRGVHLSEAADAIAHLFGHSLRALTSSRGGYSIEPSLSTRNREANLWRLTLDAGARPLFRVAEYAGLPVTAFDERALRTIAKHPDDVPLLEDNAFYLRREGPRTALAMVTALSGEQRGALLDEEELFLPVAAMTDRERQQARWLGMEERRLYEQIGRPLLADPEVWAGRFGVVFDLHTMPLSGAVTALEYGVGGSSIAAAAFSPDHAPPDQLPVRGNPYDSPSIRRPPHYAGIAEMRFPRAFRLAPSGAEWLAALEALSKCLDIPVYSDDYTSFTSPAERGGLPLADLNECSLAEGLDRLCEHFRRLWWLEGNALLFRSRTWFRERQYETPAKVRLAITAAVQQRGRLGVPEFDLLASLTYRQLQGLDKRSVREAGTGGQAAGAIRYAPRQGKACRRCLSIFAQLRNAQKRDALQDGLTLDMLNMAQQNAFLEMAIIQRGPRILRDTQALRFRILQGQPWPPNMERAREAISLSFYCTDRGSPCGVLYVGFDTRTAGKRMHATQG